MLPRWISWLFVAFMAYLIYTGTRTPRVDPSTPAEIRTPSHPRELPSVANYPKLQQLVNGNRWKRAIDPTYVGEATITDATIGQGEAASCGQEVTIHLRGTLADGANFDSHHDEAAPLTFHLGDAPYAVLNDALIGMRPGGVRQISAPPSMVYAKKESQKTSDDVLLRVEMDKVAPMAPDTHAIGLRIYQEEAGQDEAARCGTPMKLGFQLWSSDGSLAYATPQPVALTLGKDHLPPALVTGLDAMLVGEVRTLLVPPQSGDASKWALPAPIGKALYGDTVTLLTITRME